VPGYPGSPETARVPCNEPRYTFLTHKRTENKTPPNCLYFSSADTFSLDLTHGKPPHFMVPSSSTVGKGPPRAESLASRGFLRSCGARNLPMRPGLGDLLGWPIPPRRAYTVQNWSLPPFFFSCRPRVRLPMKIKSPPAGQSFRQKGFKQQAPSSKRSLPGWLPPGPA